MWWKIVLGILAYFWVGFVVVEWAAEDDFSLCLIWPLYVFATSAFRLGKWLNRVA